MEAVPGCPGCDTLRAENAELKRRLEALERAGKRQAAPFRKGPPKPDPKPPGRKAGDEHGAHGHRPTPPPDHITECHDATLPDDCPHCHGVLVETAVAEQFQTEIPRQPIVRQFKVHIGQCQSWIAGHYQESSPVTSMVRLSGMAERSFKRRFQQSTGMSPLEYVHALRLEEAKRRLETSHEPIETIAKQVGYEDAGFFSRLFRRNVHLTPAQYRRRFASLRRSLETGEPQSMN